MFVPFFSSRKERRDLYRRKGGGGKGGGSTSSGKGGTSGTSGSTGSSSSAGRGTGRTSSVGTSGGSRSATPYSNGGGSSSTIGSGQLFAGRTQGGATRSQVYGTNQYGSGYPGVASRGVGGLGFPFYFWPLAWGGAAGVGGAAYLHNSEYGKPDNSSRPGGVMVTAAFVSNSTSTTYHLIADNTTVTDLIGDITTDCSANLDTSKTSTVPSNYNDTDPSSPQPESAVQYYRASSVALTLDGYNNTAALEDAGAADTPLPSNIDTTLLQCLNTTIGAAVPLVDGANARWASPNVGVVAMFWVVWCLSTFF